MAFSRKHHIPIHYWSSIEELIHLDNCDIVIDEIGNYFDSRLWTELSLDARQWLSQGAKQGIEIYGAAQDFAQVDKSFRRLVNELYEVRKLFGSRRPAATKPPVKKIWGVCVINKLDPDGYNEDKKEFSRNGFPSFFFIRKEDCEIFNTNQKLEVSKTTPLRHTTKVCPDCGFSKIVHS